MNRLIPAATALTATLFVATPSMAATLVTLHSDFESPTFSTTANGGTGNIANDPNATGQGGWGGWNAILDENGGCCLRARITDERAHTGTQSMLTTRDSRTINKALDANPQPGSPNYGNSGGEYPFHSGGFTINSAYDWWVQAYVWINPGASAGMTLVNGLGGCPLLHIGNVGIAVDAGVPYANSCTDHSGTQQPNLGSPAFGQWLLLEMVHTVAMGQQLQMRVSGTGVDWSITLASYSGPGSGNPAYLGLAGDAYWDDVSAGYGAVPAPVPLPAAAWLMATAIGALASRPRRRV